jgi:pimeloyl-ACP methyl ester carboxylesterase
MKLPFEEQGQGAVVVLLHGFPFDPSMWSAQVTALSAAYRVILPDLRGDGREKGAENVYPIDQMADDLIETLDHLRVRDVVLGGLSMGGYVALSAIVRQPAHFRALLLMDTRAGADSPEAAQGRLTNAAKIEAEGNASAFVEGMIPKLFAPASLTEKRQLVASTRAMMMRTSPESVAAALRGMAARPARTDDLAGITQPTLVIVGEHDVITPPAEAEAMAAALDDARLVIVPKAGHLAPMESPNDVNQAIAEFLSQSG